MAESSYIGLDDVPTKTPKSKADEARKRAEEETNLVLESFHKFLNGVKGPWSVPASAIVDRLDVKHCLPRVGDVVKKWKKNGFQVVSLSDVVDPVTDGQLKPNAAPDTTFTFLRVRYDGVAEEGETRLGREITYAQVQRAAENDLVVSNIAMVMGAVCVLPKELTHTLISSEFTIMRLKDKRFAPWFLWGFLRSPEARARLLSQATGISRHRVSWDFLKNIPVPLVSNELQKETEYQYSHAVSAVRDAEKMRYNADSALNQQLGLNNDWALKRLKAAKPPK